MLIAKVYSVSYNLLAGYSRLARVLNRHAAVSYRTLQNIANKSHAALRDTVQPANTGNEFQRRMMWGNRFKKNEFQRSRPDREIRQKAVRKLAITKEGKFASTSK